MHWENGHAGEGVCIFIHESVDFKKRKDLSISNNDSEIPSIEVTNKTKNIILSSVYDTPNSGLKEFKSWKAILCKRTINTVKNKILRIFLMSGEGQITRQ